MPIKSDRHSGESRNPGNAEHPLDTGFRRYDAVLWGESLKLGKTLSRISRNRSVKEAEGYPGPDKFKFYFTPRPLRLCGERSPVFIIDEAPPPKVDIRRLAPARLI
ncbi:MAG: hypothetical protein WAW37_03935 [Syntrophobacteraceae bacterium]